MSELTSIRDIVIGMIFKEPKYRRKSSKCETNHHKDCKGTYRRSHGEAGSCECLCHTTVAMDPNL